MRYSNWFYFITKAALVNTAQIPAECVLVEAGQATAAEWKLVPVRTGQKNRHIGGESVTSECAPARELQWFGRYPAIWSKANGPIVA